MDTDTANVTQANAETGQAFPATTQEPQQSQQPETPTGPYKSVDDLPQDVKGVLPEDAQRIFLAAFNSVVENNGNAEAAARVAWETIKTDGSYHRNENGQWYRVTQQDPGGHNALGTMPNS
jgi:cation transport regulator